MTDGLDQALLRALAFEHTVIEAGLRGREHVLPGVPAAMALRRGPDGPDLFSMRCGSPAATLSLGLDPRDLFRQLLGRGSAAAEGRDAGSFPTRPDLGLLGPIALPGKGTEVMAGAAMAFRMQSQDRVALYLDDVAGTASGDWHEGFNFAAVRRAPLVCVIDATGPLHPHTALDRMVRKSAAYGVKSWTTTLASVEDMVQTVAEALAHARSGEGTGLVEVLPAATVSGPDAPSFRGQVIDRLDNGKEAWTRLVAEMAAALADVQADPEPDAQAAYGADDTPAWYRTSTLRMASE